MTKPFNPDTLNTDVTYVSRNGKVAEFVETIISTNGYDVYYRFKVQGKYSEITYHVDCNGRMIHDMPTEFDIRIIA